MNDIDTSENNYDQNALSSYLEGFRVQTFLIVAGTIALLGPDNRRGFVETFYEHASSANDTLGLLDILVLIGSRTDLGILTRRLDDEFGLEIFQPGILRFRSKSILLIIGAIGYGQGKSITGVFDGQFEEFLPKIQVTLTTVNNLWNLVKVPLPIQAMITSNGMTGFSTELSMLVFEGLPRHLLAKTFTVFVIENTNLDTQTETQKLDLAFKNYLRVGMARYNNVQVKMIPQANPQGGLNYNPFLLILYDLRGLQIIEQSDRFHDNIIASNDIKDLERFSNDSEKIYRTKEIDLEGGSWINLNLSQVNRELMLGYLSGKDYEKDIRSVIHSHVLGLNQFLLSAEQSRDETLLSQIIYNLFMIVLMPIGFKDIIHENVLDQLKKLLLHELKICETPFKSISIIEFPVQTPYLLTEARIFPSVVINEYLKNASLSLFQRTANMTYTNLADTKRGVHPLKKLADEYLNSAKKRSESSPQFRDIWQTLQNLYDKFVNPVFDYLIKLKYGKWKPDETGMDPSATDETTEYQ